MKAWLKTKQSSKETLQQNSDVVPDYSQQEFFIKKAEAAKKRVDRVAFPASFIENK